MFNPAHMSIQGRTKSFRPSKRLELLQGQWEKKRFEQHRKKVKEAEARVDHKVPLSTTFQHVQIKQKKVQKESERYVEVMMSNLILLRHLAEIAMSKRVDDGRVEVKGSMQWKDYHETILLMRLEQVERLRKQLAEKSVNPKASDDFSNINFNGRMETKKKKRSQSENNKKKCQDI